MRIAKVLFIAALVLSSTAVFASEKPSLGVAEFTNDTSASWWYSDVGRDIASMLTNELSATEKFTIMARAKLGKALADQDRAQAGRVNKNTSAKVGTRAREQSRVS